MNLRSTPRAGLLAIAALSLVAALGALLAGGVPGARALAVGAAVVVVGLAVIVSRTLERERPPSEQARADAEPGQDAGAEALARSAEASRMQDEFLSVVVHELRDPLSPILIWTQLLRSGALDRDKTQRGLDAIERSVAAQARLIDELLDFSRAASGELRMELQPLDLGPVIHAAAEAQRPASEAKQIRLHVLVEERAGLVSGDSERLQKVVRNLIANAIASTPEGGEVKVTLKRVQSQIEISVSDGGAGMSADMVEHAFEPYRRDAEGSHRRSGPLALGLAAALHFVQQHGGEIAAHSGGPGQGSSFTLHLPQLANSPPAAGIVPPGEGAGETPAGAVMRRLDDIRVMVVDDEPRASEALRTLLHSLGAEVQVAASARQALEALSRWRPHVLISDILMPGEDGMSLLRELRKRGPLDNGNLPALALTGFSKLHDPASVMAAGFQMCLEKPADPIELVAAVASLAQRLPAQV